MSKTANFTGIPYINSFHPVQCLQDRMTKLELMLNARIPSSAIYFFAKVTESWSSLQPNPMADGY